VSAGEPTTGGRAPPAEIAPPGEWERVFSGAPLAALERALRSYLPSCRWFGGKARRIAGVGIRDAVPLAFAEGHSRLALLDVRYEVGAPELYALPLAFASGDRAAAVRAAHPGAEVAALETASGRGLLHAVDADPRFARAVLEAIAGSRRIPGAHGELVAWPTSLFASHARGAETLLPAPLRAEQSNTSIRFGDRLVLKLFRRTEPGPNPDLEIGAFLTEVARFPAAAPVLGGVEYRPRHGEPLSLAILQGFVRNDGDAWSFTLAEVGAGLDRLLARGAAADPGLAHPPELVALAGAPAPPAARALLGTYDGTAALLGRRTAELHLALASHPELDAFRPEPFTREDARALHDGARAHLEGVLALLRRRRRALAPDDRALALTALRGAGELVRRMAWLVEEPPSVDRTRIHGDYHLGQVLWTGSDFVVIDFEGEPARPLAERRAKASPLRDVAGLLRSLHYAAYQSLAARREAPERWARAWYLWSAAAFLRAYLETARGAPFLPASRAELRALLDLYLTEKAVYEIGYELNSRPDWVGLPLRGIVDLVGGEAGGPSQEAPVTKGSRTRPRLEAARRSSAAAPPPQREPTPAGPPRRASAPPAVLHGGGPGELDLHLWSEGTNHRAYRTLGAHLTTVEGIAGTSFAVWAPNAERVMVMGDFNGWDKERHALRPLGPSGVWQGFIPGVGQGAVYKYHLRSRQRGYAVDKADPFGFFHESAPGTQTIVWNLDYEWGDAGWMASRRARNGLNSPMSIYEVHLGSWRRVPEENDRSLTYRELAPLLADYAADMGFTHVELLPVTEHPFYGSWGYQTTGYFAPTSRYGNPQDFMFLVDTLHRRGLGVILDWVPSHFPADEHGLAYFDGTHLFEHADRRQGLHPDWDSYIFNYGRNEVRSFLLSSAFLWLDRYHVDGLRVDAVASMLYLDYSRKPGEWIPNRYGGRENLEAIAFLRQLNEVVYSEHPDVQTIAEESTSWPVVSRPVYVGGLGFGMKWDMGWMHDRLAYLRHDPIFRRYHHNELTFRMMYAFSENFVLPLSHDEVVHGKGSLLDKMPGQDRDEFANLRLLFADQWAQPGKKLLFMGGELAQGREWSHERSLDWHLLGVEQHAGVQRWVRDLNRLMRSEPALHAKDFDPAGFEWVDANDAEASVISFLRRAGPDAADVLVVLNFTPLPRHAYRVGVPRGGVWEEVLNSDAPVYGGRGWGNFGRVETAPVPSHGRPYSLALTLPPLGAIFLRST
jgi:1,4-alpha-glucan branching enzyme